MCFCAHEMKQSTDRNVKKYIKNVPLFLVNPDRIGLREFKSVSQKKNDNITQAYIERKVCWYTIITVLQRPDFTVTQEADNAFHLQS